MELVEIGDEILNTKTISTVTRDTVIMTHHCFAKKVLFKGNLTACVGQELAIVAESYDWHDNKCLDESRQIIVTVNGNGQKDSIVLNPVAGKAEFYFISDEPGEFIITARGDFVCQEDQITVRVQ